MPGINTSFDFDMTAFDAGLQGVVRTTKLSARRALREEGEVEMTEAKERTPVDTAALKRSGQVEMHDDGDEISAHLTFGDDAVDYALYVHEDLDAFHDNGQAKFLESVVVESAPYLTQRVAARIILNQV